MASKNLQTVLDIWRLLDLETPSYEDQQKALARDLSNEELSRVVAKHGPMDRELRQLVDAFYAPFNKHLAELMGHPEFMWRGDE